MEIDPALLVTGVLSFTGTISVPLFDSLFSEGAAKTGAVEHRLAATAKDKPALTILFQLRSKNDCFINIDPPF